MNIVGTIELIRETEQFKSGSYKRSIVVKTEEQYPQILEVEFWNDKAELLGILRQGDQVSIDVNLNGRLWESKDGKKVVFMSLSGYKIEARREHQSKVDRLPSDPIHMRSKQIGNIESNFLEDAIRDMTPDDDPF